ncbi:Na+/H+ antiporter subunit E [Streptomyces sp. SS8]
MSDTTVDDPGVTASGAPAGRAGAGRTGAGRTGAGRPKRRPALQWPFITWLVVVWVLLWGDLSFANVFSGLAVAVLVSLVFPLPPIAFAGRVRPLPLARLVLRFCYDLVTASLEVAARALDPRHKPVNSVIAVRLRSRSDLYLTLTAELLTLVPGSVVLEADRDSGTLHLHVLGANDETGMARARETALAQEERLVRALASDSELAAFERAKSEGDAI